MVWEGEGEDGRREDEGGEAVGGMNSVFIFMNPAISIGLAMRSDILGGPWLAPSNRFDWKNEQMCVTNLDDITLCNDEHFMPTDGN